MPFVNVTTDQGVLVERIDASGWDLTKPFGRAGFVEEVTDALDLAVRIERKDREVVQP
jgi:hypothetical protein